MSQPMQDVVYDILRKYTMVQAFESSREFHLRLEHRAYLPLVIERLGEIVSVAHYGELNGDAMRDPELTFLWGTWAILSITQDPIGHYAEVYSNVEEHQHINLILANDLLSFSAMWAQNIRDQGWLSNHVTAKSYTHAELLATEPENSHDVGGGGT